MITDELIISLALEGKSDKEIASISGLNENKVKYIITSTRKKDKQLSEKIYFNRYINLHSTFDKDKALEIIDKILAGYSCIEIAILCDTTVPKIEYLLRSPFIKDYDIDINKVRQTLRKTMSNNINILYQKIRKLEQQYPNLKLEDYEWEGIKPYRLWLIKFDIVEEFLNNPQISADDLAFKFGVSNTTVKNLLNDRDYNIRFLQYNYPNQKDEILRLCKSRIPIKKKLEFSKVNEKIAKILNNKYFWLKFVLTFRISLEEFAKMVNVDYQELKRSLSLELYQTNNPLFHAYNFLLNEVHTPSGNYNKAMLYYRLYSKADKEQRKKLIKIINDEDYYEIINKEMPLSQLNLEERKIIAKYWAKYASRERDFPYHHKSLKKYIFPLLEEDLQKVIEYNHDVSRRALMRKAGENNKKLK